MTQTTNILLKPTQIPWIGNIPEDWKIQRLKSVILRSKNWAWWGDMKWDSNDIVCIRVADFDSENFWIDDSRLTYRNIPDCEDILLNEGDLLLEKSWGWDLQLVWRVINYNKSFRAVTSNFLATIKTKKSSIENKFLYYLLRYYYSANVNYRSIKQTTGIQNLDSDSYFQEPIPLPPLPTQTTIANFLDQKTERISTLISNKKKLIDFLKEQKQYIIHRAVTKGIDPDVNMKNSGMPWIWEIPEDWEVKRLKYCVFGKLEYGANEPAESNNPDNPRYIRITDFWNDWFLRNDTFCSLAMEQAKNYLLQEWDILFARSGATVWKTFMFTDYNWVACFAWYLIRARVNTKIINEKFLYLYTKSNAYEEWKSFIFNESTIQNIWADKYNNLPVPIPSLLIQSTIIKYIEQEAAQIDTAIEKIEKEITLIEEYRTSLIYQAVTGKISIS